MRRRLADPVRRKRPGSRRWSMLRFTGRGYGHGVGMCVIGAGARARRGESADEILRAYYPGLEVASR